MTREDLFVGGVTTVLGLWMLLAVALNSNWYFSLPKPQRVEAWIGRSAARFVFGLLGVALVVLGLAIASGFGPNKSRHGSAPPVRAKERKTPASGESLAGKPPFGHGQPRGFLPGELNGLPIAA